LAIRTPRYERGLDHHTDASRPLMEP
jgi:hypothetical protein